MPSQLTSRSPQARFNRRVLLAQFEAQVRRTTEARGPFLGFVPDLDPEQVPFGRGCRDVTGLVARSPFSPGALGEVLMPDFGYAIVDDTTRVPGNNVGLDANSQSDIVMLGQLARTNAVGARTGLFNITPLAITAGDGSNAGSLQLWAVQPTDNQWVEVLFDDSPASLTIGTDDPQGDRNQLFDWAVMQSGSPNRTSYSGAIDQPVIVFTNNSDAVQVYPCDAVGGVGQHEFQPLTEDADLAPFLARSVENLNDSLYFLNTSEAGTRRRQRIRRTRRFEADPDNSFIGSVAFDLRDFERDGLRLLSIANNQMAAYFEDGVAFIRETGNPAAPSLRQIVTKDRGLISTHSVTHVGGNTHFGIFTDGWWFLDSSGRWREAGVARIDNIPVHKWKDTFYGRLNVTNRHRLVVEFDPRQAWIYISLPLDAPDARETWIYDPQSDRVWLDDYSATMWGRYDVTLQGDTPWSGAPGTWSTISGSWASFAAQFGFEALVHGDVEGLVFQHDPDLITQNGVAPAYRYESVISHHGSPRTLKTADRLVLEYVNVTGPGATLQVNSDTASEARTVMLDDGAVDNVSTADSHFRLTDQHLGFVVSGTAPVVLKSFEMDLFDKGVQRR